MSFKKNIEPENVLISSFKVHKTFTFNTDDSGSGFFSVPIKRGTDSSLWDFGTATAETKVVSSSTYYKVPTYHEINNLYYKDIRTIRGRELRNKQTLLQEINLDELINQKNENRIRHIIK